MTLSSPFTCQSCGQHRLREMADFDQLPRVTSDSKPFRPGGRLFVCESCGLAQKIPDAAWLAETGEIYRDYEMYHHSAANDQAVFDPVTGRPRGRCEVLVQRLRESGAISLAGILLDVGAGSGAMLAAFSATCDGWKLYGLDLDNRKESALKAIPRFEQLFTVPPAMLPRHFDLVTLVHALEHFPDPVTMLRALSEKIAAGGRLFVEVVNVERTPFDLVVADHLCHFTPHSLARMVTRAGLGVETVSADWINKEISLLAVASPRSSLAANDDPQEATARIERDVAWLRNLLEHAREAARSGQFGIFGTSVAATWLAGGLGDAAQFFVDEDPAREGRMHLSRPILKPDQLPRGAKVYLAFARDVSDAIRRRLSHLNVTFLMPPVAPA
jgi:2-polyprenyl-3-methyl-5-hydroxy-6-metoxy-1,4-benzoquinol methylase